MFTVGSLQHQHVIKTETCEYLDCWICGPHSRGYDP
jgi:hypothetical protein